MILTMGCSLKIKSDDTAATTEPKYTVSWEDKESKQFGEEIFPGSTQGSLTGATAVTVVAAVGADIVSRKITGITVYNADTSARTISIYKRYGSTDYEVCVMAVAAGYSIFYDGNKFALSYEEGTPASLATSNATNITAASSVASIANASVAVASSAASLANTKAESASTRASSVAVNTAVADSKGESASTRASSVAVNTSTADSKGVSAGAVGLSAASSAASADSKGVSAGAVAVSAASSAASANLVRLAWSTFDSVVTAGSIALSGASVAKASYPSEGNDISVLMSCVKSGV